MHVTGIFSKRVRRFVQYNIITPHAHAQARDKVMGQLSVILCLCTKKGLNCTLAAG